MVSGGFRAAKEAEEVLGRARGLRLKLGGGGLLPVDLLREEVLEKE